MKTVIRFLLRTEAGKIIIQTVVSIVVKAFKKRLERLPYEKRRDLIFALDLAHDEIHSDVTVITDDL